MGTDKRKIKFDPSPTSKLALMLLGLLLLQISVLLSLAAVARTLDETTPGETAPDAVVSKCCSVDKMFYDASDDSYECVKTNGTFVEFKIPKYVDENGIREEHEGKELGFVFNPVKCNNDDLYEMNPWLTGPEDTFRVSETGLLRNKENKEIAPPGQFCVERYLNSTYGIAIVCSGGISKTKIGTADDNTDAAAASDDVEDDQHDGRKYLRVGIVISLPFLFCTFLAYALVGKLQNLHGKSLMCYVVTLSMAYVSLLTISFKSDKSNILCKTLAYGAQFSFLACFYWLNIMCFDLWWTFSGHRSRRRDSKEESAKKFKMYSIYTWGCSSLITTITYCIQSFSLSDLLKVPDPNFGTSSCFYNKDERDSAILYFYGPIGTLIFCNLFMFAHTAIIIVQQLRSIDDIIEKSESRKNVKKNKQRFVLYLKLFFIMGVNWLIELVSYGFDKQAKNALIMHFFDFINASQGVFIFAIFVCKKDVLILLNEKLYPRRIFIKSLGSSYGTYNSTSNVTRSTANAKSLAPSSGTRSRDTPNIWIDR